MFKRIGVALGLVLLQSQVALANIGAGSSRRMFMTDILIDGYNVTNNVYVPLTLAVMLLFFILNLVFGWVRIGPFLGKLILAVFAAGLGVVGFLQSVGGNMAAALLG